MLRTASFRLNRSVAGAHGPAAQGWTGTNRETRFQLDVGRGNRGSGGLLGRRVYQRFRDKGAFFGALVANYVSGARATTLALFRDFDDDRLIGALVVATATRFRNQAGLIRAAIRKRMEDPAVWEPIRLHGHFTADNFIEWLAARRGRALTADEVVATRFAFQVLFGTLNNAVINQPGPLDLGDAEFVVQLERAFRLALLFSGTPPAID